MDYKKIVKEGYDTIAAKYLASRSKDSEDVRLLEELVPRLTKGAKILDAGCGAGVPVTQWLSRFFEVIGVDISEEQIRLARQLVPQARFVCGDMTALPFPPNSFDAICSYYAIIHVPREEHRRLLQNLHRLLKPAGLALLCMGAGDWEGKVEPEAFLGASMYWSHYDADTNIAMLRECGFDIVWSRLVVDSTDPETVHLFVLAQKG